MAVECRCLYIDSKSHCTHEMGCSQLLCLAWHNGPHSERPNGILGFDTFFALAVENDDGRENEQGCLRHCLPCGSD